MILRCLTLILLCAQFSLVQAQEDHWSDLLKSIDSKYSCQIKLLKKLGWTLEVSAELGNITYSDVNACEFKSLEESKSKGALKIILPVGFKKAPTDEAFVQFKSQFEDELSKVLMGPASGRPMYLQTNCAFRFLLSSATKRAVSKIHLASEAKRLSFAQGEGENFCKLNTTEWRSSEGTLKFPNRSIRTAIQSSYTNECSADSSVGLQLLQLLSLYEVYQGDSRTTIDSAYNRGEMCVGQWKDISRYGSHPFGPVKKGSPLRDEDGLISAKLGPMFIVGLSGIMAHFNLEKTTGLEGEKKLEHDSRYFQITSISPQAAAEIVKENGILFFNQMNAKIWESYAAFEKEKDVNEKKKILEGAESFDKLLKKYAFYQMRIYTHPYGVLTLESFIRKLLVINSEDFYEIRFFPSHLNTDLFTKFLTTTVSECEKARDQEVEIPALRADGTNLKISYPKDLKIKKIVVDKNHSFENYDFLKPEAQQYRLVYESLAQIRSASTIYALDTDGKIWMSVSPHKEGLKAMDTNGLKFLSISHVRPFRDKTDSLLLLVSTDHKIYYINQEKISENNVQGPEGSKIVAVINGSAWHLLAKDNDDDKYYYLGFDKEKSVNVFKEYVTEKGDRVPSLMKNVTIDNIE